jgi:hypothetical protein
MLADKEIQLYREIFHFDPVLYQLNPTHIYTHIIYKISFNIISSGYIDPHVVNLGTRWRWVVSFTPRPLYARGTSLRYLSGRRLGGPQSRSGRSVDEKNVLPLLEIEPIFLCRLSRSQSLCRLNCPWSFNLEFSIRIYVHFLFSLHMLRALPTPELEVVSLVVSLTSVWYDLWNYQREEETGLLEC